MSSAVAPHGSLCISVTFLTGRYHGEEWPPSPARLYQALVAAVMTCGYQGFEHQVESALRWLESQPPPRIRCCVAEELRVYRIAVPNNDMDVAAWEWQHGRFKNAADLKTMKQVSPRGLPETGPHVQYIWPIDPNAPGPPVEALRQSAHLLHTLGWGIDMAFADVAAEQLGGTLYEPAVSGERRWTPMRGTLDDLKAAYERFRLRSTGKGVDSSTRPSMLVSQPYRPAGEGYRPYVRFRLLRVDDPAKARAVRWEDCQKVAAWLRHRAAAELRSEIDEEMIGTYVQGHVGSATSDKSQRLSYVPLPSISGPNPDGLIRRAMIVEPPNMPGDITEMLGSKLSGAILTATDGKEECCLAPPEPGDWTFRQYLPLHAVRVWRSVTPVVLHGHNTRSRGVISVEKTEALLLRAFEMAGFLVEQIAALSFQAGPMWGGSKHSAAIRVPAHLDGYPRLHVEVRFAKGVHGPVLAGIGRHYGIGLFVAIPSFEA